MDPSFRFLTPILLSSTSLLRRFFVASSFARVCTAGELTTPHVPRKTLLHDGGDGLPRRQHSIPYPPPTPRSSLTHSLLRVLASLVPSSVLTLRRSFSLTKLPPISLLTFVGRITCAQHPHIWKRSCALRKRHTQKSLKDSEVGSFKRRRRSKTCRGCGAGRKGVEEGCTTVFSSPLKVGNNS